ncbi:MAG: hypothetical protein ABI367_11780 [Mucilaginibacter sp.]
METLIINVPEKKSALVKQLLKELGVKYNSQSSEAANDNPIPNKLTAKTIDNAHKSIGLNEPIKDIKSFIKSL